MGDIHIGNAKAGRDIITIAGDIHISSDRGALSEALRAVFDQTDEDALVELLQRLDAEAVAAELSPEAVEAEAARVLDREKPPRRVFSAASRVAQTATGGVISQTLFTLLRPLFEG
jgi:hypothetical protein